MKLLRMLRKEILPQALSLIVKEYSHKAMKIQPKILLKPQTIHAHTHVPMHKHICACTHVHTHAYQHAQMRAHTHACSHFYMKQHLDLKDESFVYFHGSHWWVGEK